MNFQDLYRLRSEKKLRMRKMKSDRTKWAEYALLGEEVKELTRQLKELAKFKPANL